MDEQTVQKMVVDQISKYVPLYMKTAAFTDRKLTDLPTDSLQVVNRKYVTLNGTTSNRPVGSVLGQRFFDTSLNKPVWYGNSGWVDATGAPV